MTDMNHVIVIGRITRDIDQNGRVFAYTTGGIARLSFSIAANRSVKKNGEWTDSVSYFDVTVWGKTAENIKPYLHKGKQVAVEGFIEQQRWQKDGITNSKVVIIADNVQLLGGNDNGKQSAPQTQQPAGEYQSAGSGNDYPEDIPF